MQLVDRTESFQKMVCLIGSGVTVCEILRVEIPELLCQEIKTNPVFLMVDILLMVA